MDESQGALVIGTAQVSTNKRITLPSKVMKSLDLVEGDYVSFKDTGAMIIIQKVV